MLEVLSGESMPQIIAVVAAVFVVLVALLMRRSHRAKSRGGTVAVSKAPVQADRTHTGQATVAQGPAPVDSYAAVAARFSANAATAHQPANGVMRPIIDYSAEVTNLPPNASYAAIAVAHAASLGQRA